MNQLKQKFLDPIPVDFLIDIFSRVPAKSIGRFRCVSKFWESILGRPDFTELFLTRSLTCPRLLFITFQDNDKILFYSSPQSQILDDDNSTLVATKNHLLASKNLSYPVYSHLHGLVCIQNWGREATERVIFNPITGESVPLPRVEAKNIRTVSYLGYDPIDKQFKVLCMINMSCEHRVLTLETGKEMVWRRIKCKPHHLSDSKICINGVLYYRAWFQGSSMIVCFDVRSEKFSFIYVDVNKLHSDSHWALINYKGKLGAILRGQEWLVLLVHEDGGKHKWTKHICILPPLWNRINALYFVGIASTGEIVVLPHYLSDPFYVLYCNPEKNIFRRVRIKGFEGLKNSRIIDIFSEYIEDVKLLQSV